MTPKELAALANKYRPKPVIRCPLCRTDPKVLAILSALKAFHKTSVATLMNVALKEYGIRFSKSAFFNHFAGHPHRKDQR